VLLLELRNHFFDLPEIAADASRQPVALAKAVEHGAAYALHGVGLELRAFRQLVAPRSIEQPHHSGLDDVVDLHRRRQ
jgi:hypothetical protein